MREVRDHTDEGQRGRGMEEILRRYSTMYHHRGGRERKFDWGMTYMFSFIRAALATMVIVCLVECLYRKITYYL